MATTTQETLAQAAKAIAEASSAAANDATKIDELQKTNASQADSLKALQAKIDQLTRPTTPTDPGTAPRSSTPRPPVLATFNGPAIEITEQRPDKPIDYAGALVKQAAAGGVLFHMRAGAAVKNARIQGLATTGTLFEIEGKGVALEDVDIGDNSFECIIARGGAEGFTAKRLRFRTHGRYGIYNEGAQKIVLEDWLMEDAGPDGVLGTADDDGGSKIESQIRLQGVGSGVLRRIRAVFRGGSNKANIRGDGTYTVQDSYFSGANGAVACNPLHGGDGGQGQGLDRMSLRAKVVGFGNADAVRAAVMDAARKGEKDGMKLMRVMAGVAIVEHPDDAKLDQAKRRRVLVKDVATDADYAATLKYRADQLVPRSDYTWQNVYCDGTGVKIEAASIQRFDADCTIVGSAEFGWPIGMGNMEYPPGPSAKDALGWRLPFDIVCPAAQLIFDGTKLVNPNKPELFMGYSEGYARSFIKGRFTLNGVAFDWR